MESGIKKTKCYIDLMGGIANQMFQTATAFSYSKKYDKELILNVSRWHATQGNNPIFYKDDLFKNFKYSLVPYNTVMYREKNFGYDELPNFEGDINLNGYFQTFKYFQDCKDEFISLLELPDVDISDKSEEKPEVGIHIRRGDYMNFSKRLHVCNTEYFKYFFEKYKDCDIKVFTDSKRDVYEEFKEYNFKIIDLNSDIKELTRMSKCDIIVGSNSTFSWWASLLGNKECYFPSVWFADLPREYYEDIYRDDMNIHYV